MMDNRSNNIQDIANATSTKADVPTLSYTLFCWFLIVMNLLALVLNVAMTAVLWKFGHRLLRFSANRILLSLVLSDVFVSIFGLNLGVLLFTHQPTMVYKIAGSLPLFGSMFVSMTSLAMLTSDRLASIKRPYKYGSSPYVRTMTRMIMFIWLLPFLITVLQILVYIFTSTNFELALRSGLIVVFFSMAAVILTVSNIFLIVSFKKQNRVFNDATVRKMQRSKISTTSVLSQGIDFYRLKKKTEHSVRNVSVVPARQGSSGEKPTEITINTHQYPSKNNLKIADKNILSQQFNQNEPQGKNIHLNVPQCCEKSNIFQRMNRNGAENDVQTRFLIRRKMEDRITRTCIAIVIVFILCWAPLGIYRFAFLLGKAFRMPWFRRFALCLASSNSLLNPCAYLLMRKDFRKLFKYMLGG